MAKSTLKTNVFVTNSATFVKGVLYRLWCYSETIMQLILEVIDDLYTFAIQSIFGRHKHISSATPLSLPAGTHAEAVHEPAEDEVDDEVEAPQTFKTVGSILSDRMGVESVTELEKNTVMYIGTAGAPVYVFPTRAFDTLIGRVPFGKMIMVLGQQGRWVKIAYDSVTGWVLREDVSDRAAHVLPEFVNGSYYAADDPNTIRTRAHIDDEFSGALMELPLTSAEYIAYRLLRRGTSIAWTPQLRPRTPGTWHRLLSGMPGTIMAMVPTKGAIMEYTIDTQEGHLAYVESLFPDGSIAVSEMGRAAEGVYTEYTLTESKWKDMRPTFIQIS